LFLHSALDAQLSTVPETGRVVNEENARPRLRAYRS
jgi:hypothetical protein